MKRAFLHITVASCLTLVAYLVLNLVWRVLLEFIPGLLFKQIAIALMVTASFGYILLYVTKIRKDVGEEEVLKDYGEQDYISFKDDLGRLIDREKSMLIMLAAITLVSMVLRIADDVFFDLEVGSLLAFPTLAYFPMLVYDTVIPIPYLGYFVSLVADTVAYLLALLIYRKKKYNYWKKSKEK